MTPSKKRLSFRLGLCPTSLHKHLRSEVKMDEVGLWDPHSGIGVIQAAKTILKKGSETIPPWVNQSSGTELYTQSVVVSFTHKPDTCPSTCSQKWNKSQAHHWNLLPVDMGTLSWRVRMLFRGAHMYKKKTTSAFTCKSGTKSCEPVPQYHASETAPTNH